ncbi:MAG: hypothetical protein QF511_01295 [Rhodospirillales bacterium]|nr:hypothetical protein [Rhodospirillales bacterium]HIJ43745.1 hypothetical protein [Rhodospirillaceae bacterium]MDP7097151.1 hypothetical protein [Rhodospirillales bacterium]MDP7215801.1 hypothetical protein [Rhodospirillales bacterium]HIJ46272.1 hypothetical protein [Rhodospirillaceae bacterium]
MSEVYPLISLPLIVATPYYYNAMGSNTSSHGKLGSENELNIRVGRPTFQRGELQMTRFNINRLGTFVAVVAIAMMALGGAAMASGPDKTKGMNPCAMNNPCAAKNPCAVKNPCADKPKRGY